VVRVTLVVLKRPTLVLT